MNNKKFLIPLLLVLLITVSVSAVSAADIESSDINQNDSVAVDDTSGIKSSDIGSSDVTNGNLNAVNDDTSEIQSLIDNANVGDTIELENKSYTVKNIKVNKTVIINGNGATIVAELTTNGHIFDVAASDAYSADNVVIKGITFKCLNSNSTYYDPVTGQAGSMLGSGIYASSVSNLKVDSCSFIDLGSGIYLQGCKNTIINNSYFNGAATKVANVGGFVDKTGKSEEGTKAIALMRTSNTTVNGSTFDGWVLDAVSMASGSQIAKITNNKFLGNAYGFFFGGGVSDVIMTENYFEASSNAERPTNYFVSAAKSCSDWEVSDNTFILANGTKILIGEIGNTMHGAPTPIGPFNFTNNIIKTHDGVDSRTTIGIYVLSNGGTEFNPKGTINIVGNDINDAKDITLLKFWNKEWQSGEDIVINPTVITDTKITVENVSTDEKTGKVKVTLTKDDGTPLVDKDIDVYFNGEKISLTTDENGIAEFEASVVDAGSYQVVASFTGENNNLLGSSIGTGIFVAKKPVIIVASSKTLVAGKNSYSVTLKDQNGNLLANKNVTIKINGEDYTAVTNSNGVATVSFTLSTAKTYTAQVTFEGDNEYKVSSASSKLVVKYKTAITASNKKIKVKKAGKISLTLKNSNNKVLKSKKVKITFRGKTYTVKTNSKGVAYLSVKVTKKGSYKAVIKYAGDSTYISSSKTITVKIY